MSPNTLSAHGFREVSTTELNGVQGGGIAVGVAMFLLGYAAEKCIDQWLGDDPGLMEIYQRAGLM